MTDDAPTVDRNLRIEDLEYRFNVDKQTIRRWYEAGTFPKPFFIGRRRFWLESVINDFIKQKAEAA